MNGDTSKHRDEDESNRPIPNFRPQINASAQPMCYGLVEAQADYETRRPPKEIKHAQNKAASPPVEDTQQHEQYDQNINSIESHLQIVDEANSKEQSARLQV
jgi:hypothetical protein